MSSKIFRKLKETIKKALVTVGFLNPALGSKVSAQIKANHILQNKRQDTDVFVETGTEFGTMIKHVGDKFKKIYSIEYDTELFNKAKELFKEKSNVILLHGDSGVEIQKVLTELNEPALFWLDAHGSGAMTVKNPTHCPVEKELRAIFAHSIKKHIILIDDVRHFDRHTIGVIKKLVKENGLGYTIEDGLFIIK